MSKLSKFFLKAVAAQMEVAGDSYTVTRPKSQETFTITGIVTSRDGSSTAEAGGTIVSITAHLLTPITTSYTPKVGDRITDGLQTFMVVSVIASTDDAAYSCDLINVQA